jgi:predicted RNase H-like nuclease
MKVVGVDGCKGGWIAIVWDFESRTLWPEIHPRLSDIAAAHSDAAAMAIDIPIGLSHTGIRACDFQARARLGLPRSTSVFPPPIPDLLACTSFAEATAVSRARIGRGISIQSFSIIDKIREANEFITVANQDRWFEMHPEVSFWALAGGRPMTYPKRKAAGYEERRALLERAMEVELPERTEASGWDRRAKPDDLLDATVAAWSAWRKATGQAKSLGDPSEVDDLGLRMEMVY